MWPIGLPIIFMPECSGFIAIGPLYIEISRDGTAGSGRIVDAKRKNGSIRREFHLEKGIYKMLLCISDAEG